MCGLLGIADQKIGLLQLTEDLLRPADHGFRKSGELCDLNTEALVGGTPYDLTKEKNIVADLLDGDAVVYNALELSFQLGQFMVMRCEQRLRTAKDRVRNMLENRPCNGQTVECTCSARA